MSKKIVCDKCGKSLGSWDKVINFKCTRYYESGKVYNSTEGDLCLDCCEKFVNVFLKEEEENG